MQILMLVAHLFMMLNGSLMSQSMPHNPITIYTTNYCPYCTRAKDLLRAKGLTFTEIDVTESTPLREEMVTRTGRRTVPQIFIGDHHVGGFDDLSHKHSTGQLNDLLNPLN